MSDLTVWNGVVYLSGQVALDHAGADFETQVRAVFARIDELLATVGTDRGAMLTATVWLVNSGTFKQFNILWLEWLGEAGRPVRATVVSALALEGLDVEIQVSAAVPDLSV
jgi:enamine deaminase RidA (YjgF/YER057c/UK114 family)